MANKLPFLWHLTTKNTFFIKPLITQRLWVSSENIDFIPASLNPYKSGPQTWPQYPFTMLKMFEGAKEQLFLSTDIC